MTDKQIRVTREGSAFVVWDGGLRLASYKSSMGAIEKAHQLMYSWERSTGGNAVVTLDVRGGL